MMASDGMRQRRSPGEVCCGYDRIEHAPRFSPALGEQGFRVLRRVELFEPALGKHQEGYDLRHADEIE